MARFEDNKNEQVEQLQEDIAKLKKGLKRKSNKKLLSCSNCLVVAVLFFVIIFVYICYFLAASGIKNIPILSARLYREPQPVYLVESSVLGEAEKDIIALLKNKVQQKMTLEQKLENITVNLDLREEQLTSIIRQKIADDKYLSKKIEFAQMAILPDYLEIYLKSPQAVVLVMQVVPRVKNNALDLEVVSFKIGQYKLPKFVGNISIIYATEKIINNALNIFKNYGSLQSASLYQGKVTLEILINNLKNLPNVF